MASLTDLKGTGELILALFAAQLTAQKVTLPDRRYFAPGSMIVWDGEQLTVNLQGIDQGQPGIGYGQSYVPEALNFYAQFSVNLVREVAVIGTEGTSFGDEVPTAQDIDADGQAGMLHASALIQAASAIYRAHTLTGVGEGFVIGPLQPLGPAGGLMATRLLISVSVD